MDATAIERQVALILKRTYGAVNLKAVEQLTELLQ